MVTASNSVLNLNGRFVCVWHILMCLIIVSSSNIAYFHHISLRHVSRAFVMENPKLYSASKTILKYLAIAQFYMIGTTMAIITL